MRPFHIGLVLRSDAPHGNLDENRRGSGREQSHATWFPRGLLVRQRSHRDLQRAISCSFPEKASAEEVNTRPVGPSHVKQRLHGRVITQCILHTSHTLNQWAYSGLKFIKPKLNKQDWNGGQMENSLIDYMVRLVSCLLAGEVMTPACVQLLNNFQYFPV